MTSPSTPSTAPTEAPLLLPVTTIEKRILEEATAWRMNRSDSRGLLDMLRDAFAQLRKESGDPGRNLSAEPG